MPSRRAGSRMTPGRDARGDVWGEGARVPSTIERDGAATLRLARTFCRVGSEMEKSGGEFGFYLRRGCCDYSNTTTSCLRSFASSGISLARSLPCDRSSAMADSWQERPTRGRLSRAAPFLLRRRVQRPSGVAVETGHGWVPSTGREAMQRMHTSIIFRRSRVHTDAAIEPVSTAPLCDHQLVWAGSRLAEWQSPTAT